MGLYTNYTMFHMDDQGHVVAANRPKQKYSVGEIVDVNSWTGMKYGFVVEDIDWIFHDRLCQYCWGYKVRHPEGKRTGLTFAYIPEGYLREHEPEENHSDVQNENDIKPEEDDIFEETIVEDEPRFINFGNVASSSGGRVCIGADGKPIKRTPDKYPYSYDPFVVWKSRNFSPADSYVYSDRMMQQNHEKFADACKKVWKNTGQMFYSREPEDIEKFLSIYFDREVELTMVMEGCNVSNGYPYWIFILKDEV